MTVPSAPQDQEEPPVMTGPAKVEAACPDCGHDVDHTVACPEGCALCAKPDWNARLTAELDRIERTYPILGSGEEPHKHDERAVTDLKPGEFRVRGWDRFWHRLEDESEVRDDRT